MIEFDKLDDALSWLRSNAGKMADARADRLHLEQYLKVRKAELMAEQAGMSVAAAEMIALSSPRYLETLDAYKDAVKRDEHFRFYAAAESALIGAWRTQEATKRAEGKAYAT